MSDRTYAKVPAQQKTLTGSPFKHSLLQRTCACGQHTIVGTQCPTCRNSQSTLLRFQRTLASPPILTPAEENVSTRNSSAGAISHCGHDFSRVPVYSSRSPVLQTKFMVNQPGDVYEQEADQVAEQVMRMADSEPSVSNNEHETKSSLMHKQRTELKVNAVTELPYASPLVHATLSSSGQPLDARTRAFMEPRFGHDFSRVRVHIDRPAVESAQAINARAYSVGSDVVFGEGQYNPGTSAGRHLLAHELTHVVQQSRGTPKTGTGISASTDTAFIQRFSPPGHREATIEGLKDSVSAEDIGRIEAANWERDFSQGSPKIANVVIAWSAVKQSAVHNNGIPAPELVEIFKRAVTIALDIGYLEAKNERSLGGYRSWEHMDNPGGRAAKDANVRWYGKEWQKRLKEGALPGYILDSRAYIKDNIVAAVDTHRKEKHLGGQLGHSFDVWQGVKRPKGYIDPQQMSEKDLGDIKVAPRTPIVSAVTEMVKARHPAMSGGGPTLSPLTADHLGRAMHAMEDFFAHSTWLEIAIALKENRPPAQPLITGTFDIPDQEQSLGYKLIEVAYLLLTDYKLLLKIYSLKSEKDVKEQKNPIPHGSFVLPGSLGELMSVIHSGHVISKMQKRGKARIEDYAASKVQILQLAAKGREMVTHGTRKASQTGHGRIAKDEPEEKGHQEALKLATEADRLVIGPLMREVMNIPDDGVAKKHLTDVLFLVDTIIAPPGTDHPLFKKVIMSISANRG